MKLFPNSYHQLISSLPPLPSRLDACGLPISQERLQDRLRMLEPEDQRGDGPDDEGPRMEPAVRRAAMTWPWSNDTTR